MSSKADLINYVNTLTEGQSQKILDMIKNSIYPEITDSTDDDAFSAAETLPKGKIV